MYTPKYLAIAWIHFKVPAQYFSHDMKVSKSGAKNLLWQVKMRKNCFIYTISDDGVHHVLTDEGAEYVRDKIIEQRM